MRYVTGVRAAPLVKYLISSRPRRHFEIFFRLQRRHTTFFSFTLEIECWKDCFSHQVRAGFPKTFPGNGDGCSNRNPTCSCYPVYSLNPPVHLKMLKFRPVPETHFDESGQQKLSESLLTSIYDGNSPVFLVNYHFWRIFYLLNSPLSFGKLDLFILKLASSVNFNPPTGLDLVTYSKNLRFIEF